MLQPDNLTRNFLVTLFKNVEVQPIKVFTKEFEIFIFTVFWEDVSSA
jgi:hypothetical protein